MSLRLFLCVDCGGSKTLAILANSSGDIVGRALSGPANLANLSTEKFTTIVSELVHRALVSSNHSTSPDSCFVAAWFALAGLDSPMSVDELTPILSRLVGIPTGPRLIITNDTPLLAESLRFHPDVSTAVAIVAGTGSNSFSFRLVDGQMEALGRSGGWGWMLGDEGSGYHVGREAMRQIMLENDKESVEDHTTTPGLIVNGRDGSPSTEHVILRIARLLDPFGLMFGARCTYTGQV
jgi:N-acetylglucosamine kinase-like BadF-type ATPase